MGVWSTSLYGSDFAADLRSAVGAVVRLPFEPEALVDTLCSTEPMVSSSPDDPDYTTFWLVVADQFAKKGIDSPRARDTALSIIESDADILMHRQRGMGEADLKKRKKTLQDIRTRILNPESKGKRSVLKAPQSFVMDLGDVIVYPTSHGRPINPYLPLERQPNVGRMPWTQDGWGTLVVIDRGRAFDFLAWYRPLTMASASSDKPSVDTLKADVLWMYRYPGTCSPMHFKRMGMEKIGTVPVDPEKVLAVYPLMKPGVAQAISDISIANELNVRPDISDFALAVTAPGEAPRKGRTPSIMGIRQILRDPA